MTTALIHNIGVIATGDIDNPTLEADSVFIKGGKIEGIGSYSEFKDKVIDLDIDAQGQVLCPGLIDEHGHLPIGDWHPGLKIIDWMANTPLAGITTLISVGDLWAGRPSDREGLKAAAILARKTFDTYRPGGLKVHAGALVLENCLTEDDIREVANEGVTHLAEIGLGMEKTVEHTRLLIKVAKECRLKVPCHFGPPSQGALTPFDVEAMISFEPDVFVHFNGGPVRSSKEGMKEVIERTSSFLELTMLSNYVAVADTIIMLRERDEFRRITIGTDTCTTPKGWMPQGVPRMVSSLCSVHGIPGAVGLCFATGNTARAWGLNRGMVKPGMEADLLVISEPPGSMGKTGLEALEVGDPLGVGMVMIDGEVITRIPFLTFHTAKPVLVNGQAEPEPPSELTMF